MPLDCHHYKTNEQFNYKNPEHIKNWGEFREGAPHPSEFEDGAEEVFKEGWSAWIDNKTNEPWQPTDMHTKTTLTAFPELADQTHTYEFKKKWRYLGKSTNFAKNYGCGPKTLASNLEIDLETATKLSDAYNQAYPGVAQYQNETQGELSLRGFTTNLYGRKYYIEKSTNYYKGNNYVIQGTGADALKEVEIKICEYLKDKKSRFILPIHDELALEVHPDEEDEVPRKVKEIMESVGDVIKCVPMVSEVEMTDTNWAEKHEVKI
jgi:DNA polymerase I-like protein with 3'-5' exonuclease and polymerase domains